MSSPCSVRKQLLLSPRETGFLGLLRSSAHLACRFSISMLFSRSILHRSSFCFLVSSRTLSWALSSCSFSCSSRALALRAKGRRYTYLWSRPSLFWATVHWPGSSCPREAWKKEPESAGVWGPQRPVENKCDSKSVPLRQLQTSVPLPYLPAEDRNGHG